MPDLVQALRSLTENVKVNAMERVERDGRCFYRKRRRLAAKLILPIANLFFRAAGAPLRATLEDSVWQRWGVECFAGLHGPEGFRSCGEEPLVITIEELPGTNLTVYLDSGRLQPWMAAAAGRELRRAHAWQSPMFRTPWSHGDSHAGNFILDEEAGRARLIDFELMHVPALPAEVRQTDDIAGFLLDLVGRIEEEKWLPCAEAFLEAYGPSPHLTRLPAILGQSECGLFPQLWRGVQTGFLSRRIYRRRMERLLALPSVRQRATHSEAELLVGAHASA
jgi:hypothetical protein